MGARPSDSARSGTLEALFGVDLRSLALFRVALASALLYDVADRSRDLVAHYTDLGVLPADLLLSIWGRGVYASPLYHLSASPPAVAAVFVLFAASAFALLVGWRTRWAAVLCWFLLASVQVRNPFAAALGGDKFLRVLVFWSLFLPLGARWSFDAARTGSAAATATRVLSVPSAALLLQICLMYWTTGLRKDGETWQNGTALFYALNLDYWASASGVWLREQASVLPLLSYGARWFEILGPFLAFAPVWTGPARALTVAAFWCFHFGLATFMDIGPFPLFCSIAWAAYLPGWFWDSFLPRLVPSAARWVEVPGPNRAPIRTPAALQAAAGAAFVYVAALLLVTNGGLRFAGVDQFPAPLLTLGKVLRINQGWTMFSADPPTLERWPVLHGQLASGAQVDPLRGAPVMERRPELLSATFPSFRWRLYYAFAVNLAVSDSRVRPLHQGLSDYFCRRWNQSHSGGERMERLQVELWSDDTDRPEAPLGKRIIYEQRCPTDPAKP